MTVQQLVDAVTAGDLDRVREILQARPELVNTDMAGIDERRALHFAVMARAPEMVRVLMRHGADARKGIYPHRSATTAFTLAKDRGYDEIVAIFEEEEGRREPEAASEDCGLHESLGPLTTAVENGEPDTLKQLLDSGLDPDEPLRVRGLEQPVYSNGMPLWLCAQQGHREMAGILLQHGADPNAQVYASGSPMSTAYGCRNWEMVALMRTHGGHVDAIAAGHYRETELARKMLSGELDPKLDEKAYAGKTLPEQLLWSAACGGDPEIVKLALAQIDWPRDDTRWYRILEQPARFWNHMGGHWEQTSWDRTTYAQCFALVLQRCDPNIVGRFGLTMLHDIAAAREHVTGDDRLDFATMLLDAGARMEVRDHLLKSTPLGWACRWGREEMVKLLIDRGADVEELATEPWATPRVWAKKMGHQRVLTLLEGRRVS